MHELSLCQGAVELIEKQVAGQGVKRVTAVWMEAGATTCIEAEALHFAFDCATKGTMLEDAILHFKTLPTEAWCWGCEQTVEVERFGEPCPKCQGHQLNLKEIELTVKQVEVE